MVDQGNAKQTTGADRKGDHGEPLSLQGLVLRLIFGVFLILWWLIRKVMTVGGGLGAVGVVIAIGGPALSLVLFLDREWYAREGAGDEGGDELTWAGASLFLGLFVVGAVLWVVGIVRRRAARRGASVAPALS